MKHVKSDKPKKNTFEHAPPVRRETCPICGLPGDPREIGNMIWEPTKKIVCAFFNRCRDLKFDDDRHVSANKKSEHFRTFHGEWCVTCREPFVVCRQKKVSKVTARAKKLGSPNGDDWYLEPQEVRELADVEECKPPNQEDYTPVMPTWWRPEGGK